MIEIKKVPCNEAPVALLLEADPSEEKISGYLGRSHCYIARLDSETVGACVIQPLSADLYELMSIAVSPGYQKRGIGSALLDHAITAAAELGARRLEVGTGSFGYQLRWYQRAGFRVVAVERDFFLENYDHPIYEDGVQLKDMLRLTIDY